jgi:hypothetical protein
MIPTPIPIALRAYTLRKETAMPQAERRTPPPNRGPRRKGRPEPRWPKQVLVFDTETTTDETQRLIFGSYRADKWNRLGNLDLITEGLFYADDLSAWNPAALAELQAYAAAHSLPLLSRRDFVEKVFRRVAIDARGLVVGFNLPFDLSRIAIDAGEARFPYYGGFSLTLWENKKSPGKEHPFRPRVCVKSLDSKRAFIGFTRPMGVSDANERTFRGHFLDLRTLAFALSTKSHSLLSACKAFGVSHGKLTTEEHGRVTAAYIDYNRRDVLASQELLEALRREFDGLGLSIPATSAYSPASIVKAHVRDMNVRPLREKSPSISAQDLGRAMTAFYGGRAECRVRRVSVPVVLVDFRSMYPTVSCLMGIWPLLTAESVRFEDNTDQVRALLAGALTTHALDPALWPQLAGFVELAPEEAILPTRGKYTDTREGLNIGVNYLTSLAPLVYAAPDVYASALLTGRTPNIQRAWRLVGEGIQPGLAPISLGGKLTFDPTTEDFFQRAIEERVRTKASKTYSPEDRTRLSQLLKIIANSGYGIFAEMNRETLPIDDTATISVFGHGEPFEQTTQTPEALGTYCYPPVAALICAAARLMLAILEQLVTERGGTYAFCDTDSMAIVATKHGGLLACEGGTADSSDRIEAIRALAWDDVRAIQTRFDALSPYDRNIILSILIIEDVNFVDGIQREVCAYVISAKRYALFQWSTDGSPLLIDWSDHGLGHLSSPVPAGGPEEWTKSLWQLILDEEFGIPHNTPDWLKLPAVSQVSISTPAYFRGFLRQYAELPYAERVKPFGFVLSGQVARLGHPEGVKPTAFHLIAPFSKDPAVWASQLWVDTYGGGRYGITTGLSYVAGVVGVKSVATVKAEFLAHGEAKSEGADGEPAGAETRGLLYRRHVSPSVIRLSGKESNVLEMVEAGLLGDRSAVVSTYGGLGRPSPELLRSATAATIARACNRSVRTVREWRRKDRLPPGIL